MARNIMSNERPPAVTGEFDPCRPEGEAFEKCLKATQLELSYAHFEALINHEECMDYRVALDRCRSLNGMPTYWKLRKQDDVPRAPFRKNAAAADRMVQEVYPYPGGKIP